MNQRAILCNQIFKHMNIGIIIQARLSSTRLPQKVLLPFYGSITILDILIDKLKLVCQNIVIATSLKPENDELVKFALNKDICCYRGSENDVLQRFIDAAKHNNITHIIRICSDNPFLDVNSLKRLISAVEDNCDCEYISFNIDGVPSIKTHYGFWAEYVSLDALMRIKSLTSEHLYHEHVTNFIYTHPDMFNIKWLDVPTFVKQHKNVRLTIDTKEDFENAAHIYTALYTQLGCYPTMKDVLMYLDTHSEYYKSMESQIIKNSKK
ncbi:glycosyl transferase family 2 [Phocaeicola vulgatus]|uniref:cytidylyltransferase domain-containing protein n=1 Tax=Phocaeicola vulgatus TaxID=821 RepID=UPI0039B62F29